MYVSAIIVAGGRGLRLGADRPKQLLEIGGRSMLHWSVDAFDEHPAVDEVVVVLPASMPAPDGAGDISFVTKKPLQIAVGGERRQDSVEAGFGVTNASADVVLVHDAARPFVGSELISRVIETAVEHGAAVPATRANDTVKRAAPGGGRVLETVPRETIWLAQTPQGFRRGVLLDAMRRNRGADVTDEAMLAERAGHPVQLVQGDEDNVKITTLRDLENARERAQPGLFNREEFRVGHGYDLHRLVEGRRLLLAGVEVPFEKGPLGHSDGDVVCHAICDALFGAAAMGDIGRHFPNTDPRWKDAPGLDLLQRAVTLIRERGWRIVSADCTVILEKPKLSPFIDLFRSALASVLGCHMDAISVKAKTNEGVDAAGRGEAIAAHAVAVVTRPERAKRVEG